MTRKMFVLSALVALLVAAVAVFFFRGAPTKVESAGGAEKPAAAVSALIKTSPLQKQALTTTLTAFGDVTTGKVVTLSFPRAGLVTLLQVQAGQRVAAGTALLTLSSDPGAQLAFAQAASTLHLAQGELQRNQQLFALQLATQSQVATARKTLQDAQAALAFQKTLGGDVAVATVNAPFDGIVVVLSVVQGDRITAGAPLLQLGHTDALRVQLGIEPSQSRLVKVGMSALLSPLQNPAQSVSGKITELQNLVDPKTQLVSAMVVLPVEAARFLVPGMHAQGVIDIGQQEGWVVPRQAVLSDDNGPYVFQVVQGKAHRVSVTKANEDATMIGIDGKLDAQAPVVVLGNYELQEGMTVREGAQ